MADPDRNKEFKGTDGTVGFIIAWNGDRSVGEGSNQRILQQWWHIELPYEYDDPNSRKELSEDIDVSLSTLKNILEK